MLDESFLRQLNRVEEKINLSFKNLAERINDWGPAEDKDELKYLIDGINEQLLRFQSFRATGPFDFEFVERYFGMVQSKLFLGNS